METWSPCIPQATFLGPALSYRLKEYKMVTLTNEIKLRAENTCILELGSVFQLYMENSCEIIHKGDSSFEG